MGNCCLQAIVSVLHDEKSSGNWLHNQQCDILNSTGLNTQNWLEGLILC